MDDHPVVLEQRVEPLTVGACAGDARFERIRREQHEHAEEADDAHQRRDHVRLERPVAPLEPGDASRGVSGQQEQPPQERSVLSTPERGEQVARRHRAVAVTRHVTNPEVVRDERVGEQHHREQRERGGRVGAHARGLKQARVTATGCNGDREGVRRADEDRVDHARAELGERLPHAGRSLARKAHGFRRSRRE
jgi:hypothetical protein